MLNHVRRGEGVGEGIKRRHERNNEGRDPAGEVPGSMAIDRPAPDAAPTARVDQHR